MHIDFIEHLFYNYLAQKDRKTFLSTNGDNILDR